MSTNSRYRKVYTKLWADEKFAGLSAPLPNAQTLWVYLLTGPHTRLIPGLYGVGEMTVAEGLHWPLDGVRRAMDEITALGMARFDRQRGLLFIPRAIEYDPPANPNVVRGWRALWDDLPECDLKREAYDVLRENVVERGENFERAFDASIHRPNGFRNDSGNGSPNGSDDPNSTVECKQKQNPIQQGSGNRLANGYRNQGTGNSKTLKSKTTPMSSSHTVSETVSQTVRDVFAYWQEVMASPRSMLDAKRTRLIKAALTLGYTVDDLKRAIRGCSVTPHNMGMNERGQKYNDLALIMRDAEHIERFIAHEASPPKPVTNGNGHARDDWFRSDQGIVRKAHELGIAPRAGESYAMLRERVQAKLDSRNAASAP